MKKLIIAACLLSSPAFADKFDGAYVGVNYGTQFVTARGTFIGSGAYAGIDIASSGGQSSQQGELTLGYGKQFDWRYIGAESSVSFSGVQLAAKPGIVIFDHTLLYTKIGYEMDHFVTIGSVGGFTITPGIERVFDCGIGVRAQLAYTEYFHTSFQTAMGTTTYAPRSRFPSIGVTYHY